MLKLPCNLILGKKGNKDEKESCWAISIDKWGHHTTDEFQLTCIKKYDCFGCNEKVNKRTESLNIWILERSAQFITIKMVIDTELLKLIIQQSHCFSTAKE